MGSGASKGNSSAVVQVPVQDDMAAKEAVKVDSRLPYEFRELFTLKNYWC